MPELPEVEHLRRTLEPMLLGARVTRVVVRRRDVIATDRDPPGGFSRQTAPPKPARLTHAMLLAGDDIATLERKGKQLSIVGSSGRNLVVHLGMSGRCLIRAQGSTLGPHTHISWVLRSGGGHPARLDFIDHRRFGGVWALPDLHERAKRWARLGPDALEMSGDALIEAVRGRHRPIKAALLDQALVAGLGNIYVDESLHTARIHPVTMADSLALDRVRELAAAIRGTLRAALRLGGSTISDYRDASGTPGGASAGHRVYARAGLPCTRCRTPIERVLLAGRSTHFCPRCQR